MADRERGSPPSSGERIQRLRHALRRVGQRPDVHRLSWRIAIVVLAFIGAALGLTLAGSVTRSVGPVHARFSLSPSASMQGGTSVNIPPLGSLQLDTNRGPVQLNATVTDIDTRAAQRLINNPEQIKGIEKRVTHDVNAALAELIVRATIAALVGAGVLTFVVTRRWRAAVVGVVVIVLAELASGGAAYLTWNSKALAEPRYTGLLSRAPALIGDVQDIVQKFGKYSTELAALVGNVSKLYAATSTLPQFAPTDTTIRVLHVSDIHDNPEAWDVIQSISHQFNVDFIVDTGDLTDHGTAAENVVANGIGRLGKPYVYIKGNHDSATTVEAVESQPNAIVLNYTATELQGLRIYGAPDPRFTPDQKTARSEEDEKSIAKVGEQLAIWVQEEIPPPIDIVMVHDPAEAKALDGIVPLVLAGHLHKREVDELKKGTLVLVEGSTGGAGLRALDHDEPTPLEASVLYFDRTTKELQAYDDITLGGLGLTSVNVVRHLVTTPSPSPSPSPSETPSVSPSVPVQPAVATGSAATRPSAAPAPSAAAPAPAPSP